MANLTVVFIGLLFKPTKTKADATKGWQYCECMKHRGVKSYIKINIGTNTEDQEKLYKKYAKYGSFARLYVQFLQ